MEAQEGSGHCRNLHPFFSTPALQWGSSGPGTGGADLPGLLMVHSNTSVLLDVCKVSFMAASAIRCVATVEVWLLDNT